MGKQIEPRRQHQQDHHHHRVRSLDPRKHQLVNPAKLRHLHDAAYSVKDRSILSNYVLCHWWNYCVAFLPATLSANMVSLLGFLVSMVTPVMMAYHLLYVDPDVLNIPSELWFYASFGLFAYQTLDAIDGKQARRTGTASPLGEMFDHGCDAFHTVFIMWIGGLAVGYTDPTRIWFHFFLGGTGFFLAIWEQYSTGTVDLPPITGPVEGLVIAETVFFWTGLNGTRWWIAPFAVPTTIFSASWLGLKGFDSLDMVVANPQDCMWWFMFVVGLLSLASNLMRASFLPYVHDNVNPWRCLAFHFSVVGGFSAVIALFPVRLREASPFAYEFACGFFCALHASRINVARMCKSPYCAWNVYAKVCWAVIAAHLGIWGYFKATSTAIPFGLLEGLGQLTYWTAIFGAAYYLHFILAVFTQFSSFLGVNIFTMTKEQKKIAKARLAK